MSFWTFRGPDFLRPKDWSRRSALRVGEPTEVYPIRAPGTGIPPCIAWEKGVTSPQLFTSIAVVSCLLTFPEDRMRIKPLVCAALAALLGLAGPAMAQSSTGGLRGAVRDAQGVIPGVTVTLTNDANGTARDTISNASGEYLVPGGRSVDLFD